MDTVDDEVPKKSKTVAFDDDEDDPHESTGGGDENDELIMNFDMCICVGDTRLYTRAATHADLREQFELGLQAIERLMRSEYHQVRISKGRR